MLPIRVHCWGGLGSQLFAYIVANRMRFRFPGRRIQIRLHTGGITRRNRELPEFSMVEVLEIDDYPKQGPSLHKTNSMIQKWREKLFDKVKPIGKQYLKNFGLFNDLNSEVEWARVRPWIVSSRGHYSQLQLTDSDLNSVCDLLSATFGKKLYEKTWPAETAIHIRLGDLMSLKPEALDFVPKLIRELKQHNSGFPIKIYSDSNLVDVEKFLGVLPPNAILVEGVSTLDVIYNSLLSHNFIGSNSKVTFWIAALRVHLGTSESTLVPTNIFRWLSESLPNYNLAALGVREY